jgi:hypothetical protein
MTLPTNKFEGFCRTLDPTVCVTRPEYSDSVLPRCGIWIKLPVEPVQMLWKQPHQLEWFLVQIQVVVGAAPSSY